MSFHSHHFGLDCYLTGHNTVLILILTYALWLTGRGAKKTHLPATNTLYVHSSAQEVNQLKNICSSGSHLIKHKDYTPIMVESHEFNQTKNGWPCSQMATEFWSWIRSQDQDFGYSIKLCITEQGHFVMECWGRSKGGREREGLISSSPSCPQEFYLKLPASAQADTWMASCVSPRMEPGCRWCARSPQC